MKDWLLPSFAVAAGFGIGAWTILSPSGAPPTPSGGAASTSGPAASMAKVSSIEMPALSAADFASRLGRLLVALKGTGKGELLAQLEVLTQDKSILPALADFYRKELTSRLVALGAEQDVIAFGDARQRDDALEAAVGALALRDVARAETMVFGLPAGEQRQVGARALLAVLGKSDAARGLALLREHPDLRSDDFSFFQAWAAKDPRRAAEAALQLEKELGGSFVHGAIYQWTMDDPSEASKWVENLPPGKRQSARSSYMNALVNKDPSAALDLLQARPELGTMFASWIGDKLVKDRADAEALLARVPPGEFRTQLVGGITETLLRGDPGEALTWAQTLLPGERDAAIRSAFRSLAYNDPSGAMALADKYLQGKPAEQAIVSIAGEWMMNDFEGGFAALTRRLQGDALKRALNSVMTPNYSLIGKDPTSRFDLISKLEPGTRRDALRAMGSAWGMIDPRPMQNYLGGLDPDDRSAFVEGLMRGLDTNSPQLAAGFAKWLPIDKQVVGARRISGAISATDPAAAAAFLLSLPGDRRALQPAMQDLVREWSYEDPAAAMNFAGLLPAGEGRDSVALELARQLKNFDPQSATRQLSSISGASARATLLRELTATWKHVDPGQGRSLLLSVAQTDAERASIVKALGAP